MIQSIGFEVVTQPCYSPHLAPSDSWSFAAIKKHPKGICFTCDEEVPAAAENGFENSQKSSTDRFEKLVQCWQHCII
jgi:hypothetical protein